MIDEQKESLRKAKRIVIKIGSNTLTNGEGLNTDVVEALGCQVDKLLSQGKEVILVSSGSVACGMKKMGFSKRPEELPEIQASSAIGQSGLMLEYEKAFANYNRKVAQILLTRDDLSNRRRYLNTRNTLYTLLSWGVTPIINENDTVVTAEIKFGDNDNLSAMIALQLNADLLINLTDIDGLYDKDPRNNPDARLIPVIRSIHKNTEEMAGSSGDLGTGGMLTKIQAARKTTAAGVPMLIACGKNLNILSEIFSGMAHGTFFCPQREKLNNRKSWLAFHSKPTGKIVVDAGAKTALIEKGKSLLPSGILFVEGEFEIGSPVECVDAEGHSIAIGLANYKSSEVIRIKGKKTAEIEETLGIKPFDEIIHRNNLVITEQHS